MTVTEDFAEDVAVIHDPESKEAFHVEQHGIDFIPESERWATPGTSAACGPGRACRSSTSSTAPS